MIEEARATSDLLKKRSQRSYEGLGTNDIQDSAKEEKKKKKKFIVVSDDVGNEIADPEQELNKAVGAQRTCVRGNICIVSSM